MHRKTTFVSLFLLFGMFFLMTGCSQTVPNNNLVIINNSSNDLKAITMTYEFESFSVIPADNRFIKPNEEVTFNMEANEFTIVVTDAFGHEFTSQKFNLDFTTNKVFTISITQNTSAELFFDLVE